MVRSVLLVVLFSTPFVLFTAHHAAGSETLTFVIETVVSRDGTSPSLSIDGAGRPWIGYWVLEGIFDGSMHFAVHELGAWNFETVPFLILPPTNTIVDATGSPAVGYNGTSSTLEYLHKSGGVWVTESIGGFEPHASALTVNNTGTPFAAFVWSYASQGYISVSVRAGSQWVQIIQYPSNFNPPSSAIDIATDGNGDPHICVNPVGTLFYYTHQSDTGWGDMEELPYNLSGFSLAISSQSQPMISYTGDGKLRLASKESGAWTTSIVGDANDCVGTDLVIDTNDVPHIVYCHRLGDVTKLLYAVRNEPNGSWAIHEVDEGSGGSIAVDPGSNPHIAYLTRVDNPSGWDLKYATVETQTPVRSKSWGEVKSLFASKHKNN